MTSKVNRASGSCCHTYPSIHAMMALAASKTKLSGLIVGVALLGVSQASANPVQYGSNFFSYISSPGISWMDAQAFASSLSYNGASGYLAVITSSAENSFLTSNFTISSTSFEGAWLGGQCNASNACFWETGPLAGQ